MALNGMLLDVGVSPKKRIQIKIQQISNFN